MIKLSDRLMMSVRMVDKTECIADVGCDHAHMDIRLLEDGTADRCIAMDVRTGPLGKAEENLKLYGHQNDVELRLSDGLHALRPCEAGCVIIAGMGGVLMRRILEEGLGKYGHLRNDKPDLVLQPQSHIDGVRRWLYANGYCITDEDICYEEGKYYFAMKAVPSCEGQTRDEIREHMSDAEFFFGPVLLKRRSELFLRYMRDTFEKARRRLRQVEKSNTADAEEKKNYFKNILEMINMYLGMGV